MWDSSSITPGNPARKNEHRKIASSFLSQVRFGLRIYRAPAITLAPEAPRWSHLRPARRPLRSTQRHFACRSQSISLVLTRSFTVLAALIQVSTTSRHPLMRRFASYRFWWANQIPHHLRCESLSPSHGAATGEPRVYPESSVELPQALASVPVRGRACSAHPQPQSPPAPSICASVFATGSQMPACFHRLKRRYTLFHLPQRSGISRHGARLRRCHTMPLTT